MIRHIVILLKYYFEINYANNYQYFNKLSICLHLFV